MPESDARCVCVTVEEGAGKRCSVCVSDCGGRCRKAMLGVCVCDCGGRCRKAMLGVCVCDCGGRCRKAMLGVVFMTLTPSCDDVLSNST